MIVLNSLPLYGTVLPQTSADWLLQRQDDAFQQDVRLLLRADDGAIIFMSYRGVRRAASESASGSGTRSRMTSTRSCDDMKRAGRHKDLAAL